MTSLRSRPKKDNNGSSSENKKANISGCGLSQASVADPFF
jgi:hypothetical protein